MNGSQRTAPTYDSLPEPRRRSSRSAIDLATISVTLEAVTPILGGAAVPRMIDEFDCIRAASVRGHLRFWWRALNGHKFETPHALYEGESALWGCAASDDGGRSPVDVRVEIKQCGRLETTPPKPANRDFYALWPAREPPAPRLSGTKLVLTLTAPSGDLKEYGNAVRAWLLFGGYGSRTRRGLGSFRIVEAAGVWLPKAARREEFTRIFESDVFGDPRKSAGDVPWLAGAALRVGAVPSDAMSAWLTALDWLKEFRQGFTGNPGDRAREPGTPKPQPNRPSISNWPEADKIRHLVGKIAAHPPRHNSTAVWPRAGFGLPILGRFQRNARDGGMLDEPGPFELRWCGPDPRDPHRTIEHERLASPLIVKAMPLVNGQFVPIALWLNRAYPQNGEVVLRTVHNSAAPFDRLIGAGDTPRFSALAGAHSLREAFLDWLHAKYSTTVVAQ
jgi:CRISPR-associated protein Cmr1